MAGLREKQKAAREQRILGAAISRFRHHGYHAVRIEDLAEEAEVSVGTIYNYYRTKGDILIAMVSLEVEEVLCAGAAIVADPPGGVDQALLTLIFMYYDHSLHYLSKEMWRTAMALSIEAAATPNGQRYRSLDKTLTAQVSALIAALQARGEIAADLDADAFGAIIFNDLNMAFIDFVRDEAMSIDELKTIVTAQIQPLARLISA